MSDNPNEMIGNAAAMYKALKEIRDRLVYLYGHTDGTFNPPALKEVYEIADTALAKLPRNCDVFKTESEMRAAFIAYFNKAYDLEGSKYVIDLPQQRKEKPMEASNLQELKDAAIELMKFTCNSCEQRFCEEDIEEEDGQWVSSPCSAIIRMRNALSANPICNCNVGSAQE